MDDDRLGWLVDTIIGWVDMEGTPSIIEVGESSTTPRVSIVLGETLERPLLL